LTIKWLTASQMPRMAGLVKLHCNIEATGERQEWADTVKKLGFTIVASE